MSMGFDAVEDLHKILSKIKDNWEWALHEKRRPVCSFIFGPPGIGKTMGVYSLLEQYTDGIMSVIPASTIEPPDIAGALKPREKFFEYLPPEWAYPLLEGNLKTDRAILFIDDVPAAYRQVQSGIFKLVHEGRLGPSNKLDNRVLILLAGNRPEDEAGAQKILTALGSRCQLFTAKPDVDYWINEVSLKKRFHPSIRAAIIAMPQLLNNFNPKLISNPCPRSWETASNIFYAAEFAKRKPNSSDIDGVVGSEATNRLFTFLKSASDMLKPQQILQDPDGVKMPSTTDAYYLTITALEAYVLDKPDEAPKVLQFTAREDTKAPDMAAIVGMHSAEAYSALYKNNIKKLDELYFSKQFTKFIQVYPAMIRVKRFMDEHKKNV